MTESTAETFHQVSAPLEGRAAEEFLLSPAFTAAVLWVVALLVAFMALLKAERDHHRGELLAAYKRRKQWKKSDVQNLNSLGVNKIALRRIEKLVGTGRPVVPPHQPFGDVAAKKLVAFLALCDERSSAEQRKQAFKQWPWWPHYVEALYRGEHALAKTRGIAGPSEHAERLVGSELGISASTVHRICGEIRRKRKEWDGAADFPAMTLSEYRGWMEAGNFAEARLASGPDVS
jgi:hypothetical protein